MAHQSRAGREPWEEATRWVKLVGGESDLAHLPLRASGRPTFACGLLFESGFYVLTGEVWASIVRSSVPAVIGTLRGLAASATGMRSASTPVL